MNVILPPPEADPGAVARALRSGEPGSALREALAALVDRLAAVDHLILHGAVAASPCHAALLDNVLDAHHEMLRAAHREGL